MQIIEVNLIDGYPFYCPVTGQQILTEDDFIPSPAMVFCYVQNESVFEYLNDEAKQVFGEQLKENYLDFEKYDKIIYELLSNELTSNWVCFRLCTGRNFNSFVVDQCINMSYRE